jgi:hypothetical protein
MQINQGNNSNFQQGKNLTNKIVVVDSFQNDSETGSDSKDKASVLNWIELIVGLIAGGITAWWFLPWDLGYARIIVTVFLLTSAIVYSIQRWFTFRRNAWEKITYFSLGSIVLIRACVPIFGAKLTGFIESSGHSWLDAYLVPANDTIATVVQFAVGLTVLLLGYLAPYRKA